MSHATRILAALDAQLNAPVELTLYGRAALLLGFEQPPAEYALSQDVDAVFWLGQAEELAATTNFWEAVEQVNAQLAPEGLYISHFFGEDQVILRADWRSHRQSIVGAWRYLQLWRLGNFDLLLSKLMRNDPVDRQDARFIIQRSGLTRQQVQQALTTARVPPIPELEEQFAAASTRLLAEIGEPKADTLTG